MYSISYKIFNNRIDNYPSGEKTRIKQYKLGSFEEQTLIQYIIK